MANVFKSVFSDLFGCGRKRTRSCVEQNARAQHSHTQQIQRKTYQQQVDDVSDSSDLTGFFFEYLPIYARIKIVRRVAPRWLSVVMVPRFFYDYAFNLATFWTYNFRRNLAAISVFKHWLPCMGTLAFHVSLTFVISKRKLIPTTDSIGFRDDVPYMLAMLDDVKSALKTVQYSGAAKSEAYRGHVDVGPRREDRATLDRSHRFANVTNLSLPPNTSFLRYSGGMPRLRNVDFGFSAKHQVNVFALNDKIMLPQLQRLRYARDDSHEYSFNRLNDDTELFIPPIHVYSPLCPPTLHTFAYLNSFYVASKHYAPLLRSILTRHTNITNICLRLIHRRDGDPFYVDNLNFDHDWHSKGATSSYTKHIENEWMCTWERYPHVRVFDLAGWFANPEWSDVEWIPDEISEARQARTAQIREDELSRMLVQMNRALIASFPGLECVYLNEMTAVDVKHGRQLLEKHSAMKVLVFNIDYILNAPPRSSASPRTLKYVFVRPAYAQKNTSLLHVINHDLSIYTDCFGTQTSIDTKMLLAVPGENTFLETIIEHMHYVTHHSKQYNHETYDKQTQSLMVWKDASDSIL